MGLARLDSLPVSGVVPPQLQEALIREVWATVAANKTVMSLARRLIRSVILAPLGWLILAPFWAKRLLGFLPGLSFLTVRYTLTNRRLMIQVGMKPKPRAEISLDQIQDVRVRTDENSEFYVTGDLDILDRDGKVAMTLLGVPEPESFRQSILQAKVAWAPYLRTSA